MTNLKRIENLVPSMQTAIDAIGQDLERLKQLPQLDGKDASRIVKYLQTLTVIYTVTKQHHEIQAAEYRAQLQGTTND